ncbi:MAG: RNA polymerase sigma-D factor [Alphaproteobacteria bacterium MarineAlpha9_Bin4]|nr:MAG: RNA polymerase sigma-D factor [Alphaproteobacteria bacterium MarineAlpha9_Bin4]
MVTSYKNINFSEKDDLIKENTLLVKKIAWHYHGRVKNIVEIDDLMQIGMLGLITAAKKFTERPGVSFSSYAKIRIKGEIVDYLRKNSNLCRTTITNKQKYEKTLENLRNSYNREPTNNEIAKELNINIDELYSWKEAFAANKLEDIESVYDEFSIWFHSRDDTPEENLTDKELRNALLKSLHKLEKSESLVIQLYYVEELNVFEIAEILDVSNGRVSQIKSNAIKKLRVELKNII